MLVQSAVLPMAGRPARMMRSEDCSPPIFSSRSRSPGRDARQSAVALIGACRHVDRIGQRPREGLEALAVFAGLGHLIERLLGALDQVLGRVLDVGIEGLVHEVGADADQLAPLRQLVDGAAIFLGIDDGGGVGGETREVGRPADFLQRGVIVEIGLERHRRGQLAGADQGGRHLVDAGMDGFEEMLGRQEGRNAVAGLVVDQDGAQKRLFGLQIMGRGAEALGVGTGIDRPQ